MVITGTPRRRTRTVVLNPRLGQPSEPVKGPTDAIHGLPAPWRSRHRAGRPAYGHGHHREVRAGSGDGADEADEYASVRFRGAPCLAQKPLAVPPRDDKSAD